MDKKQIAKIGLHLLEQNEQRLSAFLMKQIIKKQLKNQELTQETINELINHQLITIKENNYLITEIKDAFPIILNIYKQTLNYDKQLEFNYQQIMNETIKDKELLDKITDEKTKQIKYVQELKNELNNKGLFDRKKPLEDMIKLSLVNINELDKKITELNEKNQEYQERIKKINELNKDKKEAITIDFLIQHYQEMITPETDSSKILSLASKEGLNEQLKKYDLIRYSKFGSYLSKPNTDTGITNPKPYLVQLLKRII